jgi:hypothetical protein
VSDHAKSARGKQGRGRIKRDLKPREDDGYRNEVDGFGEGDGDDDWVGEPAQGAGPPGRMPTTSEDPAGGKSARAGALLSSAADVSKALSKPTHSTPIPDTSPADLPADTVLKRLRALRRRITGSGPSWQAACPAHADSRPSLSLTETAEGVLLVHCWGGCATEQVLAKLGLTLKSLYPSQYALQFGRRPHAALHFHGGDGDAKVIEPTREECARWKRVLEHYAPPRWAVNQLAGSLDLPREAILALKVGYDPDECCWVFPERDDRGRIVGLVRRYSDRRKMACWDSTRGLTLLDYGGSLPAGPFHLVEGPTDAAALFAAGALAVGRPSAVGSRAADLWLARLLRRHPKRKVVVVGDRDPGGLGELGARKQAERLQVALGRPVAWALPAKGFKDVREQVVAGKWHRGLKVQGGG